MARLEDKSKAIELRNGGLSYSQIKSKLGISKSTLSGWLQGMPLSEEQIRELRDFNPMRIERCRNTKLKKRQARLESVYGEVSENIGKLSKRDTFIAGLFLYWGEGTKVNKYSTDFTNTDPEMIKFYVMWLMTCFNVNRGDLIIHLHLYSDMNIDEHTKYWSEKLKIPRHQFRRPYIKKSNLAELTYRNGFGKGTCNVRVGGRNLAEYVNQSLKYIRNIT